MDISNWQIAASLATMVSVMVALWLGWTSRKYTNQLMAAEQRKQASLIRVTVPQPTVADPHVYGKKLVRFDFSPTLENASDEVITDVWVNATVTASDSVGGTRVIPVEPIGMAYLPAHMEHKLPLYCELRPGVDRIALRLELTFTDARDVRWLLDDDWKLSRVRDQRAGIPKETPEIIAGNEDDPMVVIVHPQPDDEPGPA